ncbi:hypothetical protein [Streptomyces ziwulingensis]|uniref:Uncharacterized protein n=1 Tax=Streptomyces ziwulingensis TaxID=1045501 RepID=A0ABP9BPD5_9ACTN
MPVPTQPRPHPASRGGVEVRLPWWALALPVLAFGTLLALILDPSRAQAATADPAVTHLLEWLRDLIMR